MYKILHLCVCFMLPLSIVWSQTVIDPMSRIQQMTQPPRPATLGIYSIGRTQTGSSTSFPNQHNPQQVHEQARLEYEALRKRQAEELEFAKAMAHEMEARKAAGIAYMKNGFPAMENIPNRAHFVQAFDELQQMLSGAKLLDLKRAVFVVENAFYDNKLSYADFDRDIQEMARLCKLKMAEKKVNPKDNMVKNMMLFHFLADTFKVYDKKVESVITHYPIRYDFDDFSGKNDKSKLFVTKLMATGTGQCHSMPLLYLMLAQELEAEAYMSYAPIHSFVRVKDSKGRWYNLELTSGQIIPDQYYLQTGYIKSAAIKNNLYLSTVSKKDVVAQLMVELGHLFVQKHNYYDCLMEQCADTALKYSKNNLSGLLVKSNYMTARAITVAKLLGSQSPEELKQDYPEAFALLEDMTAMYKYMDDLGYEDIPAEIYESWLRSVEREKVKPEYQRNNQIRKMVQ